MSLMLMKVYKFVMPKINSTHLISALKMIYGLSIIEFIMNDMTKNRFASKDFKTKNFLSDR